jgi:hypothetical protein
MCWLTTDAVAGTMSLEATLLNPLMELQAMLGSHRPFSLLYWYNVQTGG